MPDSSKALASRPEYSIRFASEGVWNQANGTNNLNYSFTVSTVTEINQIQWNDDVIRPNIKAFPNAQMDLLTIEWMKIQSDHLMITIFDTTGKKIKSQRIKTSGLMQGFNHIDISDLPAGLMIIKMNWDGNSDFVKFIKLQTVS